MYPTGGALLTENRSIAAATSGSPVDVTAYANIFDVRQFDWAGVYLDVTGANAGSSGNITFYFQHSRDALDWRSCDVITVALNANALATAADTWAALDVRAGVGYIRLASVGNSDATYAATVNGELGGKSRAR